MDFAPQRVNLSIGGTTFSTTRSTLAPSPFFSLLLACSEGEGEVFVDRSPLAFPAILSYLREGLADMIWDFEDSVLVAAVGGDASFYGLQALALFCLKLAGLSGWTRGSSIIKSGRKHSSDYREIMKTEHWQQVASIVEDLHRVSGEPQFVLPLPKVLIGTMSLMSSKRDKLQALFDRAQETLRPKYGDAIADLLFMAQRGAYKGKVLDATLLLTNLFIACVNQIAFSSFGTSFAELNSLAVSFSALGLINANQVYSPPDGFPLGERRSFAQFSAPITTFSVACVCCATPDPFHKSIINGSCRDLLKLLLAVGADPSLNPAATALAKAKFGDLFPA